MLFQDVIYLDLVDLDKSPNNVLVLERVMPEKTSYYQCPHHIVVSVANIVKSTLNQRLNPDKKLDDSLDEIGQNSENSSKHPGDLGKSYESHGRA
jgi:hypothetical protein